MLSQVRVSDLREAAVVLLNHLEETNGATVDLEHDYFWSVPFESLYRMEVPPADLTIGQLSESVEFLSSMVDGRDVLNFGLVWLGDLLRAIGAEAGEVRTR